MKSFSIALLLPFAACQGAETELTAAFMHTEVDGHVALAGPGGSNLGARNNDLQSSLGHDGAKGSPLIGGRWQKDRTSIRASFFYHDQESGGRLQAPFGQLPANTPVRSELDLLNIRGSVHYDVLQTEQFRLSPGVGIDYLGVDIAVAASNVSNAFERVDSDVIAPVVGLDAEGLLGPVTVGGGVRYMDADFGDAKGNLVDLEGGLKFQPEDSRLHVFAGYRWMMVDVLGRADSRDYDTEMQVRGWFVGGGFEF